MKSFEHYLDEIGREDLLTPEREIELAAKARAGDAAARDRLTVANLRFVVSVARKYRGGGLPLDDLVNEGNIGLMRAVERFDESRGVRFISYAHWWVRRAIVEALDRDRRQPGGGSGSLSLDQPLTSDGEGTLQDVLPDPVAAEPDRRIARESLRRALEASLADLPPREAVVLRRYFGLELGYGEDLSDIAGPLGVSRERAGQLRDRALARLRARSERHDLRAFRRHPNPPFRAARRGQTAD